MTLLIILACYCHNSLHVSMNILVPLAQSVITLVGWERLSVWWNVQELLSGSPALFGDKEKSP